MNILTKASFCCATVASMLSVSLLLSPIAVYGASVVAGNQATYYIDDDGAMFSWGANASAQLGDGTQVDRLSPVSVIEAGPWAQVATNLTSISADGFEGHVLAIKEDGTLWAWGDNSLGQLGQGDTSTELEPVQVGSASNWKQVEVGTAFSMALNTDGEIWVWGDNRYGQLGPDVSASYQATPVLLADKDGDTSNNDTWCYIAAGSNHALAIHENNVGQGYGAIYSWGLNTSSQLGLGHDSDVSSISQVGSSNFWRIVEAGTNNSYAINTSSKLYSWGIGAFGALGLGENSGTSIVEVSSPTLVTTNYGSSRTFAGVSAGTSHTLAWSSTGQLFGAGQNVSEQLGISSSTASYSVFQFVSDLPDSVVSASAGKSYSILALNDGSILTTGVNDRGQLGNGTTDNGGLDETALGQNDLTISQVVIDSDVSGLSAGDLVQLRVTLENSGTGTPDIAGRAGFWTVTLVPADSSLGLEEYEMLSISDVPSDAILGPSSSVTIAVSAIIPDGISVGDYQIEVEADALGEVEEFSDTNNVTLSDVTEDSPLISFTADLVASQALTLSGATPTAVDESFTVNFGLQNDGTGAIYADEQADYQLRFVLTPDFDVLTGANVIELDPVVGDSALTIDEDLAASGSSPFVGSIEFKVPSGVEPVGYYLAMLIDANDEFSETDEDNNTIVSATKLVRIEALDLEVALDAESQSFTKSGSADWYGFSFIGAEDDDAAYSPQLEAGQQASFHTNVPSASTVSFKWRASTSGDSNYLQLNAGGQELTLSGETDWEDVSLVVGDDSDLVWTYFAGSGGSGEQVFVDDISIEPLTGPYIFASVIRLLDESFSVIDSDSLIAGLDSFNLAYEIKNQGAQTSSGFSVDVYLSKDSIFDPNEDSKLGSTFNYTSAVSSGFSRTFVKEFTPSSDLSGQYYVILDVNYTPDASNPTVLASNTYVSDSASISIEPLPDLRVGSLSVNRNVFYPGNQIEVGYDLMNQGYGDAFGLIQFRLILSDDESYSASDDITIGEGLYLGGIAAGTPFIPKSARSGFTLFSFPANLPIGDFKYLGLVVDPANVFTESDETNNVIFLENPDYAFGVLSLEAALDSDESSLAYTITSDETAPFSSGYPFFGQTSEVYDEIDAARSAVLADGETSYFEVSVDVPAGEDAIATFAWKVSSEDAGVGKRDEFVVYQQEEINGVTLWEEQKSISGEQDWTEEYLLLPGLDSEVRSYTLRWSYEKDGSLSSGSDFAWIDQLNVETLELPDFRPADVSLTDESGVEVESSTYRIAQDQISLNYSFGNIGKDYSDATPLKLAFYLSADAELDADDIALGSLASAPLGTIALNSGESISGTATFDLEASGLSSGLYYLIALADPDDLIQERGETDLVGDDFAGNNLYVSSSKIVTLAAEPDLTVSYDDEDLPTGGLQLLSGALGEVSVDVENLGAGAVVDSRSIAFILQDALGLDEAVMLREFSSSDVMSGAFGTNPSYVFTRSLDSVSGAVLVGHRYNLLAFVDSQEEITESDETNNLTSIEDVSPYIFADMPLWQALNSSLLDPSALSSDIGMSSNESILIVNNESAPFESDYPFVGVEDSDSDSGGLARSIALGDGESSAFSIDVELDHAAAVVFSWKSDDNSSEGFTDDLYGDFSFSLDALTVAMQEIETDWSQEVVYLDPGVRTLTWSFERDATVPESALDVYAYVDAIRFLPDLQIDLDDSQVTDLVGNQLLGANLAPKAEFKFDVLIQNTNIGAVLDDSDYTVEARLSLDTEWSDSDYQLDLSTEATLPFLDGNSDSDPITFTTMVPDQTPLGDYYLLVRVDPGPSETSGLLNGDGAVLEVDEDNNDATSALALISIDAVSIEEGLDIDTISVDDLDASTDDFGFGAAYYKAVFPLADTTTVTQTFDLSWAESPDIEVVDAGVRWYATGGVTGAIDADAIRTSELSVGSAASLLFRLDQPRLVKFRAQPHSGNSSNYLFFGANGNALIPEGGLNKHISGDSAAWETRYYVAPSEAPIGFTYVQGAASDGEDFVYVDELLIGDPLDKPDYVIDSLQYEGGSYILEKDELFVTVTGSNRGLTAPLTDEFKVRVWLSVDASKSDDDIEVGVLEKFQELEMGTTFAYQASLILPTSLAEGNYYLIARVDADNAITEFVVDATANDLASAVIDEQDSDAFTTKDNNFLISSDNDIFIDRRADLRIVPSADATYNNVQVAGPAAQDTDDVVDFFVIAPTEAEGPSELLVKFDVLNEGLSGVSAADADDFTINVYAATARDEDPTESQLITSFLVEGGLAAGSQETYEITTPIPDNISAGSFYYLNVVVDGGNSISESDEEDNSTFTAAPNIFVSDVSLEVALNDEELLVADGTYDETGNSNYENKFTWDTSFQVPTQADSTKQAPFYGTELIYGQDNSDSGVRASARSGPVVRGGESWLQKTVRVESQLQVSFMWKVSSQLELIDGVVYEDILSFSIRYEGDDDFTEIAYISGEQDWAEYFYTIETPGNHTLRWTYSENGDGKRDGLDTGWVDDYSESSYDLIPSFMPLTGTYEAGDAFELPVYLWNFGELEIPDSGIEATVRLTQEVGDTSNLDWTVPSSNDVTLQSSVQYQQLTVADLLALQGYLDGSHPSFVSGVSLTELNDLLDSAFMDLINSEEAEVEPEMSSILISELRDVLNSTDGWLAYTELQLEQLLATNGIVAEQASRMRFLPVRTSDEPISIPDLLSVGGDYYIGVWANPSELLGESDLTNNLKFSGGASVTLEVDLTVPEALDQSESSDNNVGILDETDDWTLSGMGNWHPVDDATSGVTSVGGASLRSPSELLAQDGEASISALIEGPKLIKFKWQADLSNSADVASFYVNDTAVTRESLGTNGGSMSLSKDDAGAGWIEEQYLLPAGLNEIRWTYSRLDDSQDQGVVYVDDISFEEEIDQADLAILSVVYESGTYALERDSFPLTVTVMNRGGTPSDFDYNDLDLEVRLGLSDVFSTANQVVGHLSVVDVLDQGQRLVFEGDIDLPLNLEEGSYYLLMRVLSLDPSFQEFTYENESGDDVELLENNDYASSLQDVTIQYLPQLDIDDIVVENQKLYYPKESIGFDWQLENIGLGDIPYGTELTQTIELWSVGVDSVAPSIANGQKVLDLGSVTEVTALPGRLTAENISQSQIKYSQVYRLPSQAALLAALGAVEEDLEDLDADVIANLGELENYKFFLVLTRDGTVEQSSDLSITAVTDQTFRISAFPYDGEDPAVDYDATFDYAQWKDFVFERIGSAGQLTDAQFAVFGAGVVEQLYYYAFNLPLVDLNVDEDLQLQGITRNAAGETAYTRMREVEVDDETYSAITFPMLRGASDLIYRVQVNDGSEWTDLIDIQGPYLDYLYGRYTGDSGSRSLTEVNANDIYYSLVEKHGADRIFSVVDNNYSATLTVRADNSTDEMRVIVVPQSLSVADQETLDYILGVLPRPVYDYQNLSALGDYDADGTSNIAESQLGRDPLSDSDAGTTSAVSEYVAEVLATQYDVVSPGSSTILPLGDSDGDGISNIVEIQLGFDPSSSDDVNSVTELEAYVIESFAMDSGIFGAGLSGITPEADYDADGASNIAELQLGRDPSSSSDANSTIESDNYVAERFALDFGIFDSALAGDVSSTGDYDADGDSNIAELLLGRDPTQVDSFLTTELEDFVAETFAMGYDLYELEAADYDPDGDYDEDGMSNILEITLGRNPIVYYDGGSTTELEAYVAQVFVDDFGIYGASLSNLAPDDDYDSDGTSNIAELQLGRDPTSTVDAADTSELENYVAEAFASDFAIYGDGVEGDISPLGDYDQDGDSNLAELQLGMSLISNAGSTTVSELDGEVAEAFALDYGVFGSAIVGDISPAGDYDGDGFVNALELEFGTDPTDGADVPSDLDSEESLLSSFVEEGVLAGADYEGRTVEEADLLPDADFDGDGVTNLMEYALGSLMADEADQPEAISLDVDGSDIVLTYVRLKDSATPADLQITLLCSDTADGTYTATSGAGVAQGVSLDQTGMLSSDYERIEVVVDMTSSTCSFFKLSVESDL